MNKTGGKTEWVVWGLLIITMLGVAAAFMLSKVHNNSGRDVSLPWHHPLPEFTLTNQDGRVVTLATLLGQVVVADIIFTRCAGPCPIMTHQMSRMQALLPANAPVKLITLTTDPGYDTPEILKRYGERNQADFTHWNFLTGAKSEIARLAVEGLKLIAVEKNPEERENEQDLFIHSTLFVIVDKKGNLRASFESEDPDLYPKIDGAVRKLLREK